MLELRLADRLTDVPGPDWDSLASDGDFYLCHDWLRFTEAEPHLRSRYLLATDAGRLTGALPVHVVDDQFMPRLRTGRFADLLGFDGKVLVAGATMGYRTTLLLGQQDGGDRSRTLAALVRAALATAREDGCIGIVLPFLTTGALTDLARVARVRAAFDMAEAAVISSGLDLETYIARAPRRVRNKIRADRAKFAEAGWTIRVRSLSDCWRDAARLVNKLEHKYGSDNLLSVYEDRLSVQAKLMGDRSVVFCCEDDDVMAGFALYYRWRDTLYGRSAGFDYDRLRGASEYFATTLYEAIEYAAGHGVTALHLGGGSWQAKGYRGAMMRPLWSAFIAAAETADDPGLDLVNGATVAQWVADFAQHSITMDDGEWEAPGKLAVAGA
jgi:predicted N-acyltransferase